MWSEQSRRKLSRLAKKNKLHLLGLKARIGKKRPDNAPRLKMLWATGKIKPYWTGKKRPDMYGKKNPAWNGGSSVTFYRKRTKEMDEINNAVLKRDEYRCKLCGTDKNLIVHHIDYNRLNNDLKNLITLCMSDNSRVNFQKDSWIKYFSNIINDFYKIGGLAT